MSGDRSAIAKHAQSDWPTPPIVQKRYGNRTQAGTNVRQNAHETTTRGLELNVMEINYKGTSLGEKEARPGTGDSRKTAAWHATPSPYKGGKANDIPVCESLGGQSGIRNLSWRVKLNGGKARSGNSGRRKLNLTSVYLFAEPKGCANLVRGCKL